jgi:hypothetical protein
MFNQSFLGRTQQVWKYLLGVVGVSLGFAGMLLSASGRTWEPSEWQFFALLFGSFALFGAAFLWLSLSIRCPNCRARLFWLALSRAPAHSWARSLWGMASCPVCGYAPAVQFD